MTYFENKIFKEIHVGDKATCTHTLSRQDINLYAEVSGDYNPFHVDEDFARSTRFGEVVAHGMWTAGFFSFLLGTQLPGPGTIYMSQTLKFLYPVKVGDIITTSIVVKRKQVRKPIIDFDCLCTNQRQKTVLVGIARVLAPIESLRIKKISIPSK